MTLCKTKNLLKSAIILSIFFGFFLGFNNGNVSATSISLPTASEVELCPSTGCGENKVLHFKVENFVVTSSGATLNFKVCASSVMTFNIKNMSQDSVRFGDYYLPVPSSCYLGVFGSNGFGSGSSLFYELLPDLPSDSTTGTINITSNGTYDVSSYDSAVVNVPQDVTEIIEDPISNDFQKVFFAIVENIIPAFGIILVVWFGIDMLSSLIFGRGR